MNEEFMTALKELHIQKGIEPQVVLDAIEASLISAYKKNYGSHMNVTVSIDKDTGAIAVYSQREVVEEVSISQTEISLEDAKKISSKYKLGDIIATKEEPKNFGRIAAQTAKQVVVQRIREAERGIVYSEFSNRESDIVSGTIERIDNQDCYISLGKTEAILSVNEQMPNEVYHVGQRIKAYIIEVKKTHKGPQVIVSRTHPGFLSRLFELEVPEIKDGYVEIKSVAREAGIRSKIAVYSKEEDIDSVGSCVGPNGARVRAVVDELSGEKIDIINWDESADIYISEALSPSMVIDVLADEDEKKAVVVVPDDQLSLAIGKEGQNARLAAKMTGWKIDIKSKSQADEQGIQYNFIFTDEDELND